jgi:hypothetical protein
LSSALVKTFFRGGEEVAMAAVATLATKGVASTAAVPADSEDRIQPLAPPTSATTKKKKDDPKPGYYKLNTAATKKNGVPRYIYLGPEIGDDDASSSSSETD